MEIPAGHSAHTLADAEAKVPAAHACLSLVPPGQENPAGHGTPALDVDPGGQ